MERKSRDISIMANRAQAFIGPLWTLGMFVFGYYSTNYLYKNFPNFLSVALPFLALTWIALLFSGKFLYEKFVRHLSNVGADAMSAEYEKVVFEVNVDSHEQLIQTQTVIKELNLLCKTITTHQETLNFKFINYLEDLSGKGSSTKFAELSKIITSEMPNITTVNDIHLQPALSLKKYKRLRFSSSDVTLPISFGNESGLKLCANPN